MSDTVLTLEEATRRLPEVAARVHTTGETALVVRAGEPLVRIVPAAEHAEYG